ncbi:MAG TPA: serine hydrolase [Solirubrobacterales bacterium]|nr:serine hydrolase [Solirubrobacterales bacterium]
MRVKRGALVTAAAVATVMAITPAASAAKHCPPPVGGAWQRATPSQAGMDGQKLQWAIDYGSTQSSFAIRVYRHGCLVGEDRGAAVNEHQTFQSWSMAKSAVALGFMRAMTKRLISPEDPLGSLITEADRKHGKITMRDLLTMTSGLRWNGFRDYNIFMPDRLREALTVAVEKRRGSYFEYSQSGPALLAEAIGRAVGEDFQAFTQRQVFTPLGIEPGSWSWGRDSAGHTQGFFDLHMTPGDYGRLGELLRRDGVWRGRRLISHRAVRASIRPTRTNGCYGWLIWLNRAKPCVSPRVGDRPVTDAREFPELPARLWHFSGLFGQLVAVFPRQGIVVVRVGHEQDAGGVTGGSDWQNELFKRILAAVEDQRIGRPRDAPEVKKVSRGDVDRGFQTAVFEPQEYAGGFFTPPLPPAGPGRARAFVLEQVVRRVRAGGRVPFLVACPRLAPRACRGPVRLRGGKKRFLALDPGQAQRLVGQMGRGGRHRLRDARAWRTKVYARNLAAPIGARSTLPMTLLPPRR